MSKETALQIVKTLEEHKALGGFSVAELAEELGEFPSDVELELKELKKVGAVKCYIYKGQLYAIFEHGLEKEDLANWDKPRNADVMYR
jgi:Mn-dependent DtxR family transcriptional regulator